MNNVVMNNFIMKNFSQELKFDLNENLFAFCFLYFVFLNMIEESKKQIARSKYPLLLIKMLHRWSNKSHWFLFQNQHQF